MATRADLRRIVTDINIDKASTVYALSDCHVFIDGDPAEIIKIAVKGELEIFTFKGDTLVKPQKTKDNAS